MVNKILAEPFTDSFIDFTDSFSSPTPTPNIADIVANTYNEFLTPSVSVFAPVNTGIVPPVSSSSTAPTTMQNLGSSLGTIAGNIGGTFLGNLVNNAIGALPVSVSNQLGTSASTLADSTIVAFWKAHKTTIIVVLIAVPVVITLIVKFVYNSKNKTSKKW